MLTVREAVARYARNHEGEHFTADAILEEVRHQINSVNPRGGITQELSNCYAREDLVRVAPGVYTTPPRPQVDHTPLVPAVIEQPQPVHDTFDEEPVAAFTATRRTDAEAITLANDIADILESCGARYTYLRDNQTVTIEWTRP